jgi:hypothetical protein
MHKKIWAVFMGLCALFTLAAPAGAQEVRPKAPMYSYVANWQIPRDHWADMEKSAASRNAVMDKAIADGTLVGYGDDLNLVHRPDAETHDTWWSSKSMAGLMKALSTLMATDVSSSPYEAATKHWDSIYVSRYYNWKPGAYKGAYVNVSAYKLKTDAPDDAVDVLSQHLVVPLLEKLLSDGTINEYEIDEMAVHTAAPGTFVIVYITPTPEGLDKVDAAVRDTLKNHPLSGTAFGSMVDDSGHRDELMKGNGVYK